MRTLRESALQNLDGQREVALVRERRDHEPEGVPEVLVAVGTVGLPGREPADAPEKAVGLQNAGLQNEGMGFRGLAKQKSPFS